MDLSNLNPFKKPDPRELVRKWQSNLRTQSRVIDREIRDIQFEEKKVVKAIKEAAKRNDMLAVKTMAKEIVQSKKAVAKLYTNKAQMMSLAASLSEQLAMVRVAGTLQRSGEVMKVVNEMMKLPELRQNMMEMSREMARAGLIDEMMNEALDDALGDEDLEEETEEEVEKVMMEIVGETLAQMPNAKMQPAPVQPEAEEEEEVDEELKARLDAIRS